METFEKCPLNIFFALKKRGTTIWTLIPHNLFLILQVPYRQDITVNLHIYKCQTSSKIMYLLCKQHICYACEITKNKQKCQNLEIAGQFINPNKV
jgi:hypothetical protein